MTRLIQMSVSGAVMILAVLVIRALFIRGLPKRTFPVLWCVVLVRLLVPYSLPSAFSVYSLFARTDAAEKTPETAPPIYVIHPENTPPPAPTAAAFRLDLPALIWGTGFTALFVFFAVSYIKSLRIFRESLPVDSGLVKQWLEKHTLLRKIDVRQSDRIAAPLTYGVFRPIILLPKKTARDKTNDLQYVLTHEYVHIRRFDIVLKFVLTAALCVHWFDPLVWVMYIIANRDIEISCDEAVIRAFGEDKKKDYAMALINLAAQQSGLTPIAPHFNKSPIEERIVHIMKFRKATAITIAAAAVLTFGTITAFATSPKTDIEPQTVTTSEPTNESKPADELTSSDETSSQTSSSTSQPTTPDDTESNTSSGSDTPVTSSTSDSSNEEPTIYNDPHIPPGKTVTVEERIGNDGKPYKMFFIGWDEDDTEHKGSCAISMYEDTVCGFVMYVYRLEPSAEPVPVVEREYTHREVYDDCIIMW